MQRTETTYDISRMIEQKLMIFLCYSQHRQCNNQSLEHWRCLAQGLISWFLVRVRLLTLRGFLVESGSEDTLFGSGWYRNNILQDIRVIVVRCLFNESVFLTEDVPSVRIVGKLLWSRWERHEKNKYSIWCEYYNTIYWKYYIDLIQAINEILVINMILKDEYC